MEDRQVQYPNRLKLTPVSGQANTYDYERVEGSITKAGTPLNKANILPDTTAQALGLPNTAVPREAFNALSSARWYGKMARMDGLVTVGGRDDTNLTVSAPYVAPTTVCDDGFTISGDGKIYVPAEATRVRLCARLTFGRTDFGDLKIEVYKNGVPLEEIRVYPNTNMYGDASFEKVYSSWHGAMDNFQLMLSGAHSTSSDGRATAIAHYFSVEVLQQQ